MNEREGAYFAPFILAKQPYIAERYPLPIRKTLRKSEDSYRKATA